MKLTLITPDIEKYPAGLQPFLHNAAIYENSIGCSNASVIFIDKDNGYFIKSAPKGALEREAAMTKYFHGKNLSAGVLAYISDEYDWMLTEKINGDDFSASKYLEQPEKLCDIFAEKLAMLHSLDFSDCPIDHTKTYLETAEQNFQTGNYDKSHFPDSWGYASAEEAYHIIKTRGHLLETNTLLHGDYCLPNIIFDDWEFSGFIDLGSAGTGDPHIDLFWGAWTLNRNLKTDKYRERFFDVYGRKKIDEERFKIIAAAEVFNN